jgi:anti-sigma factor (TIGR02949 family)
MAGTQRLSCAEALSRLTAYLDAALSGQDLEALEEHINACLDCCDRLEFSRKLDQAVRARLGDEPLPEGIEQRIRRALGG